MGELNQLIFLDLSNNQLTGVFPVWVHNLRGLSILNLGQNHFSGEIPLVIGEWQNNGGRQLTNIREYIRLISTSYTPLGFGDRDRTLRVNFIKKFLWTKFLHQKTSKAMFWVDPTIEFSTPKYFLESIAEYIKAEKTHLKLNSASTRP